LKNIKIENVKLKLTFSILQNCLTKKMNPI